MKVLVLDPRNSDPISDLFVIDPYRRTVDSMRLNYVPEMQFDSTSGELLVVDTDRSGRRGNDAASYWLKMYDGKTLRLKREIQTPVRPMYAGLPNRSAGVCGTASGRYVFVLELCKHPERVAYRMRVNRYDRSLDILEQGAPSIDSCVIDFGNMDASDNEIYFHLCCEEPNTVAFGKFDTPDVEFVRMTELASRTYALQETCGGWLDRDSQSIFCTTRQGWIYRARRPPAATSLWMKLPITSPRSVPLKHIHGSQGRLYVGVAKDDLERGLSVASEVWEVSIEDAAVLRVISLPSPVINFVTTAAPPLLIGIDPYLRALYFVDLKSGKLVDELHDFGTMPAEIQLIP